MSMPGTHSWQFWQIWKIYWDRNFPHLPQQRKRISAWSVEFAMPIASMIWYLTKLVMIQDVDNPFTAFVFMNGWEPCRQADRVLTWCLGNVLIAASQLLSKWCQGNDLSSWLLERMSKFWRNLVEHCITISILTCMSYGMATEYFCYQERAATILLWLFDLTPLVMKTNCRNKKREKWNIEGNRNIIYFSSFTDVYLSPKMNNSPENIFLHTLGLSINILN